LEQNFQNTYNAMLST